MRSRRNAASVRDRLPARRILTRRAENNSPRALAEARIASGQAEAAAEALVEGAEVARQTGSEVELAEIDKARESMRAGSI